MAGLCLVTARGSCHDFLFSRLGRTTFVLLLYLDHLGNLTGVASSLLRTIKVKFLWGIQIRRGVWLIKSSILKNECTYYLSAADEG